MVKKNFVQTFMVLAVAAAMATVVGCSKDEKSTQPSSAKTATAQNQADTKSDSKILALQFHHDNWGGCVAMGPIVEQCNKESADKSIKFVKFDFTSDETTAAAKAAATAHGVEGVYNDNEKKTGFMLLVDSASGEVLGKVTPKDDVNSCKASIDKALGA